MRNQPPITTRPQEQRRRAFTLMELMLALTVTALIGGVIAVMLNSVALGTAGQQDGRRHLVRTQALQERLATTIHSARSLLAAGNGYLVYWVEDTNQDGAVELSELAMLELNSTTHQLLAYQTVWPGNYTPAQIASANTQYAATSNWYSAAQSAKSTFFMGTVLATNVTALNVSLDAATQPTATMATCVLTLSDGQVTRTAVIGAAMRNPIVPQ